MSDYTPSTERAAVSAIVLTAMGDAWSDSEEYSALPGVTADLLLTSDWLAERDRQVAERAWEEGARWAAVEFGKDAFVDESQVGLVPSDNPHRKEARQ